MLHPYKAFAPSKPVCLIRRCTEYYSTTADGDDGPAWRLSMLPDRAVAGKVGLDSRVEG